MRDILFFLIVLTFFGCNLSPTDEVTSESDAIDFSAPIVTKPVKKLIVEVRDETFIKTEKSTIEKSKTKKSVSKKSKKTKVGKKKRSTAPKKSITNSTPQPDPALIKMSSPIYDPIFAANPYYIAHGFDFPVGKPDANGYFLALRFGQKLHLGEDWNGVGGGNTDLGDPVYAVADGYISFAEHLCCGWGNTVRIIHKLDRHPYYQYVESVSSHLNDITVSRNSFVKKGDLIGHIGTADGKYSAHLHLEMRTFLDMNIGPGYSADQFGYISPTPFIRQNR